MEAGKKNPAAVSSRPREFCALADERMVRCFVLFRSPSAHQRRRPLTVFCVEDTRVEQVVDGDPTPVRGAINGRDYTAQAGPVVGDREVARAADLQLVLFVDVEVGITAAEDRRIGGTVAVIVSLDRQVADFTVRKSIWFSEVASPRWFSRRIGSCGSPANCVSGPNDSRTGPTKRTDTRRSSSSAVAFSLRRTSP